MNKFIKSVIKLTLKTLGLGRVIDIIKRKINSLPIYNTYEAAMLDADGYEDKTLVKIIVAKGKKFSLKIKEQREVDLMSLRIFIAVSSVFNSKKLTVVDFGGAAGVHYYTAKSLIPKDVVIDWRVVETTQMVKEAREQGLETSELKFYDSVESAVKKEKINLVFASGSVHCVANPYKTLEELINIDAENFLITRTPITDFPRVLLEHSSLRGNGIGEIPKELGIKDKKISYPVTMMDKSKVEKIFYTYGNIILRIQEDKAAYVSKDKSYDLWGYVVSKTDEIN